MIGRRLRPLLRRGPGYLGYLLSGVLWPRFRLRLLAWVQPHRRSRRWALTGTALLVAGGGGHAVAGVAGLLTGLAIVGLGLGRITVKERRGLLWEIRAFEQAPRRRPPTPLATIVDEPAAVQAAPPGADGSISLGELDNDGRLHGAFGTVGGMPVVDEASFVPRYRFGLELLARDGGVVLRKAYRGDDRALLREAACLARLAAIPEAPALDRFDRSGGTVDKEFVVGPTLRDLMVTAGGRILSHETEREPALSALDRTARLETVWRRGVEALDGVDRAAHDLPNDIPEALARGLDAIHARGVTGFSLTFGNIVFRQPGGGPVFIDFDGARLHRTASGPAFDLARDRDRLLFNRIYGTRIETEASVAAALRGPLATPYAPIDLGRGLVTRGFWSVDSGTGRWEVLNRAVLEPLVRGKRVLDLGTHNSLLSLMMLRSGAREVTAIERDPETVEVARCLHSVVEWRDMRRYALDLRCADMRAVCDEDWGIYDLVTAFCSLYYLPEADMRRVLRRAAEIAPTLVLQAKTDTRSGAADRKDEKSTPRFLARLAAETGWKVHSEHGPPGYTRPILVAERVASREVAHG